MEKRALDLKNPILARFWGWPLFDLQRPFSFAEDVKNQVGKLIGGRKVGVTHEKMGI